MGKKIKVEANVPVCFFKEKNTFIAYSQALDLSTSGRTLEEAQKNFTEALDIFIEECAEMGTLEDVLETCGWSKVPKKGWAPPTYIGESFVKMPACAA
jgi:predicted RNase H-like HicB family nuclease